MDIIWAILILATFLCLKLFTIIHLRKNKRKKKKKEERERKT